jgi:ABC-type multidrug transport system fused ATPase/permease subunit
MPQDTTLFHESILYNIRYSQPSTSIEQVHDAARRAQIHDWILSLPKGYDTVVGERGLMISGGERQRIALARLFLRPSPIILMDEPTAALDIHTEEALLKQLQMFKKSARVIVAHRLSTIQNADEILVMGGGRVVERGNHQQLLRLRGLYYEMVKQQESK